MRRYLAAAYALAFAGLLCLAQGSQGGDLTLLGAGKRPAAAGGGTAPVFVNTGYGEDTSGTTANTMAASALNATTGNALMVFCRNGDVGFGIFPTVSDTVGNTFTAINAGVATVAAGQIEGFYAKNITGNASNVVTCDFHAAVGYRSTEVLQYSGASTSAPLDGNDAQSCASATSCTSNTFSTTGADVVVCGFTVNAIANTFTAGNIGGAASTLRSTNTSMSGAEDKGFTTAQTNITGAASAGTTQAWLITCGALTQ